MVHSLQSADDRSVAWRHKPRKQAVGNITFYMGANDRRQAACKYLLLVRKAVQSMTRVIGHPRGRLTAVQSSVREVALKVGAGAAALVDETHRPRQALLA